MNAAEVLAANILHDIVLRGSVMLATVLLDVEAAVQTIDGYQLIEDILV